MIMPAAVRRETLRYEMPPKLKLTAVTLDCADPKLLAAFYQQATGLELARDSDDDFAAVTSDDGLVIGFQRVADYQPPRWPDQGAPQQLHLDFAVDDLDEGETLVLKLGATKPEFQPGADRWRVFTDPAGHPFCLTPWRR
jgi:predicted enzyme related to lactoylglutathione lyase